MKHHPLPQYSATRLSALAVILLATCFSTVSFAKPTTSEQAMRVVQNWMAMESRPLKSAIGAEAAKVQTFRNDAEEPLYHIVSMNPDGFVIVSGDDLVEPIIGFVAHGVYDASPDNPLGALVSGDVPYRVEQARERELQISSGLMKQSPGSGMETAQEKWEMLDQEVSSSPMEYRLDAISDVRVAPLLTTHWNQKTESGAGHLCYNLYVPNNYPCGCVATAEAQIMRFFASQPESLPTGEYEIRVDQQPVMRTLLGGDGYGGPYNWDLMVDGPEVPAQASREAIGRLTHDAAITVYMMYTSGGGGTDTLRIASSLTNTFGYENAAKGRTADFENIPADIRNTMMNPNLDAGYPVALGITGAGGHAIVGDGYGYNINTLYHHLNMGWGGSRDAWYNLPTINIGSATFNSVYKCIYNIFPEGSGEIISGLVTDSNGLPVHGAAVSAQRAGGGMYHASTNAKGIYALAKIPSNSSYHISVTKAGNSFIARDVTTLKSPTSNAASSSVTGNKWGVDFVGSLSPQSPTGFGWLSALSMLLLND